jgi:RNA polymerase sigma-70 factor (ECF subfamily)
MVSAMPLVDESMTEPTDDLPDPLSSLAVTVRQSMHRFLDVYEPLRSELYRYCRYLTRNSFDAEDLAQDAMARAFVTLGRMGEAPPNPRAWLLRVASNLWIDQTRRAQPVELPQPEAETARDPRDAREAGGTLIARLSPQERAAVVLKDVFDLKLEEVAETLSTTVGAVNAALHRARGKLLEPAESVARAPTSAVLDAFCEAFNRRDLPRLTALLLDTAAVEVVGTTSEYGRKSEDSKILHGMLFGSQRLARAETLGGIEARFVRGALPDSPRAERRDYRGEPVVLLWYRHRDGDAVRAINRIETQGDRIAGIKNYFFTPDCVADVCTELGVPFVPNGYRYWLKGC